MYNSGFYRRDDSTVDQLVADLDDGLFAAVFKLCQVCSSLAIILC